MQTWHVLYDHAQEQYSVELEVVPWWALAITSVVESLDAASGHHLCGNRYLYTAFTWLLFLDDRHAHSVHRFNVAAEVAHEYGAELAE